MHFTNDHLAELNLLSHFNLQTSQQGIKVHSSANDENRKAVRRLYEKGLVTQQDGGYLTDLGRIAAGHVQNLTLLLAPTKKRIS